MLLGWGWSWACAAGAGGEIVRLGSVEARSRVSVGGGDESGREGREGRETVEGAGGGGNVTALLSPVCPRTWCFCAVGSACACTAEGRGEAGGLG